MNHEVSNSSESHEQNLKPIERFDRLLGKMVDESETGWLELPSKWVKDSRTGRSIPEQFWVSNPKPLSGVYEAAKYTPSIMLEIGKREFDAGGSPINKVIQRSVKRAHFDENDARYKAQGEDAVKIFERLEYAYGIYEEAS